MPLFRQHRLHDAARHGDVNAVSRYILKHDDINTVDNVTGDTPLLAAVRAVNVGCVTRLLYAQGINVNATSRCVESRISIVNHSFHTDTMASPHSTSRCVRTQ